MFYTQQIKGVLRKAVNKSLPLAVSFGWVTETKPFGISVTLHCVSVCMEAWGFAGMLWSQFKLCFYWQLATCAVDVD